MQLLPECTLHDYTNSFQIKTGFQHEINALLANELKVNALQESRKYCSLVINKMRVKENLVYGKFNGSVIGFKCHFPLATQLLVLMVRGIFFKLQFPYAHFATRGITADLLFPIIWELSVKLN